ncbi:hypothetical protein [uncultured Tateyamaria sp.]|uniref:hypothetical protein n=1 Tax=uncultured Tateyamaria sp. TaxID=455651 RepID=UPI00261D4F7F|nr:hypothetical protein [uncultured Tateyamaria sp.]
MRDPIKDPLNDLARRVSECAQAAWSAMPDEVKFAMRKRLFQMNPINAIKEVGTHYRDGAWSITPYLGASGFGELSLMGCKFIHGKLCERAD